MSVNKAVEMRKLFNLFLLLLLVSCTNTKVEATQTLVGTTTKELPTNTSLVPTPLPSVTPTTIPIPTEIPCEPFRVDFCITDGHFILQRPIHPPANDLIDPTYGYASTQNGTREPHHGVEFPNPSGTPVYAAAAGTVLFAGPDKEAGYGPWPNTYGNLVVLQHEHELFTLYGHLSKIDVHVGQVVDAGTQIGEVGKSGVAIGSHLHFEVRQGNVQDYFATKNPELWLIPAKDSDGHPFGTLMLSIVDQNHRLIQSATFSLEYHVDRSQPPKEIYYGTTYSSDMLKGDENVGLGALSAGDYRIAIERDGQLYERWVEVESGKLTQVVFAVK